MITKRHVYTVGFTAVFLLLSACGGSGSEVPVVGGSSDTTGGPDTGSETTGGSSPGAANPTTSAPDPVLQALATGDVSHVTDSSVLLEAAHQDIEDNRILLQDSLVSLFNLRSDGVARADGSSVDAIYWNPTHDAAILGATFGLNRPVLRTNSVFVADYDIEDEVLGIVGERPSRNLVLGSNPMRNYRRDSASINEDMHQFLSNSINWLLQREDSESPGFNVVISQMDDSFYFPDERAVREWLDEKFPDQVSYNEADTCDNAALEGCLSLQPDLLIISQFAADTSDPADITNSVKMAMERGVPVMYLHHDGGITPLGQALLSLLGVNYKGDNYWRKLSLDNFDASNLTGTLPVEIQATQKMLNHFLAADYSFDWSQCDDENCAAVEGLQSEFMLAAEATKSTLENHDINKVNLFAGDTHKLHKLLVLIGDDFRRRIEYPMDKVTTDDTAFMQALFADYSVHYYRSSAVNAERPVLDLGNFSRGDFSHITPARKSVALQSKQHFRAAGVYALPGHSFAVTRNDSNDLVVKVFVNTQRSGSTHLWATDGYSRPKFLQSPRIEIAPGETITMTSPYGGPIQLEFDQNDLAVNLTFDNIGLHPYWKNTTDDEAFANQLQAADFDWAELSTPGFEVHSTLEKMQASMTDPVLDENLPPAQALSVATMRYVHNFPHVLSGFKGPGIDVVAEIHDFAADHNLVVDNLDLVKHMNADQATCGYGCSGNPYDAYWAFSPVGHGDIHELGHGLEKYRIRFNGWETHTMTNMYSYYTKSQFYQDTGKDPDCQSLPFERAYNVLNESLASADAAAYVKSNLWDPMGWSEGAAMFIQMMMSAQDNTALVNGWHLLSRLHLLERAFKRATALNDADWEAKRTDFGLDQYSLADAKVMDQNDWLLVAVSLATGLDHRDYFGVWGLPYSEEAASQVQSEGYSPMPLNFYVSSGTGYCRGEGFDGQKIPLDGSGAGWPVALAP